MNRILISLRVYNLNNFLLKMIDKGITIIQVSYTNKYLKCYIDKKDLPYLKKFYHLEIIKDMGKIMKEASSSLGSVADMSEVSKLIRNSLV